MSTIAITATDPETAGGVTVHRKTYCCTSELEGGRGRRRRGLRSKKEEGEEEEGGGRRKERRDQEIKIILQCLPPSLSPPPPPPSWRPLSHPLTAAHKGISKATVYTATAPLHPLPKPVSYTHLTLPTICSV